MTMPENCMQKQRIASSWLKIIKMHWIVIWNAFVVKKMSLIVPPHYRDAANCVKESDLDKYVELTKKAIDLYSLSGRASTGAGMAKECAMLLEENYDYESAIDLFSKAAHLYEMDNQNT